jgi:hypothetical protein
MSLNLDKMLQNIEVKFRGRGALFVSILAALAVLFWLVLRDYAQHPLLSQIICYAILAIVLLIIFMTQFGKPRAEDVPEKTVVQVGRVGMFFAKGLSSQEEIVALVRQWNGIVKLPPPTARVRGSATQEKHYEDLSKGEAEAFVEQVEKSVQAMLAREAEKVSSELQRVLSGSTAPQIEKEAGKSGAAGVLRPESLKPED